VRKLAFKKDFSPIQYIKTRKTQDQRIDARLRNNRALVRSRKRMEENGENVKKHVDSISDPQQAEHAEGDAVNQATGSQSQNVHESAVDLCQDQAADDTTAETPAADNNAHAPIGDTQDDSEDSDADKNDGQKEKRECNIVDKIEKIRQARYRTLRMASVNIKSIQPEPFYGLPEEDAEDWINRLKAYFETAGTDKSLKGKVFQLLLRNIATVWFKSLPRAVKCTQNFDEDLAKPFLAKFVTENTKWLTRQALEMRVMRPSETADEYIRAILLLAARLDIEGNDHTHLLIRGLRPVLKAELMGLQPKGFDDTIEKIRLAETIVHMKETSAVADFRHLDSSGQLSRSLKNRPPSQMDKLERTVSELAKKLSNIKLVGPTDPLQQPPPEPQTRPPRPQRPREEPPRPPPRYDGRGRLPQEQRRDRRDNQDQGRYVIRPNDVINAISQLFRSPRQDAPRTFPQTWRDPQTSWRNNSQSGSSPPTSWRSNSQSRAFPQTSWSHPQSRNVPALTAPGDHSQTALPALHDSALN
jgi:hypothetical protein